MDPALTFVHLQVPFSAYPGVRRELCVAEGSGLLLSVNGVTQRAAPGAVVQFHGEDTVHASLVDGPVRVLNLLVRVNPSAAAAGASSVSPSLPDRELHLCVGRASGSSSMGWGANECMRAMTTARAIVAVLGSATVQHVWSMPQDASEDHVDGQASSQPIVLETLDAVWLETHARDGRTGMRTNDVHVHQLLQGLFAIVR
jgi:hypothetical protein